MERRTALRLRVVYRRVVCPFGRNDRDDSAGASGSYYTAVAVRGANHERVKAVRGLHRLLHDCYIDSATPDHPCHGCTQVAEWKTTLGLRTYKVEPELTSVNVFGEPHETYPVQLVYLPLDVAGTRWYVMNTFTGQRFEVVPTKTSTGLFKRLTPDGKDINSVHRTVDSDLLAKRVTAGGMVHIPYVEPIWLGVPPRDQWRCTCATCTGAEQKMTADKSEAEIEELVRAMNVNTPGVRRGVAHIPSATAAGALIKPTPTPRSNTGKMSDVNLFAPSAPPALTPEQLEARRHIMEMRAVADGHKKIARVVDDMLDAASEEDSLLGFDEDKPVTPGLALSASFKRMKNAASEEKNEPSFVLSSSKRRTKPERSQAPPMPGQQSSKKRPRTMAFVMDSQFKSSKKKGRS